MSTHVIRSALIMVGAALLLTGCGHNVGPYPFVKGGPRTASWYRHHPQQDRKQVAWCKKAYFRWKEESRKGDAKLSVKKRLNRVCNTPVNVSRWLPE